MSRLTRWPLLFALLLGGAGADRTVASAPLYSSPTLSGQPALTLPAGKSLTSLWGYGQEKVATVVYGDRVYYVSRGLIGSGPELQLRGEHSYSVPPQSPLSPSRLSLLWDDSRGTVPRDWQIRVLPIAEATLGPSALKVTGAAVRTVRAQLATEGKAKGEGQLDLGTLPPGRYLVTASRQDAPASVLGAQILRVTDLNLVSITQPEQVKVWATHLQSGAVWPGVKVSALAVKRTWNEAGEEKVSTRSIAPVTTDAQGLATFTLRDGERLQLIGTALWKGERHTVQLGGEENELWTGSAERARALIQTDKPIYRPGETLQGFAFLRQLKPGARPVYRGKVTVRLTSGYPSLTLAQQQLTPDADGLVRFSFPLPASVKTGEYSVEVELPAAPTAANPQPEPDVSRRSVAVRAFVKPLFTLNLDGPQEVVSGSPLNLMARGELYQGGAANVPGEVFVLSSNGSDDLYANQSSVDDSLWFQDEDYEEMYAAESAPYIDPKRRPNQTLKLQGGQAKLPLKLEARGGVPTNHTVAVRARDEYGRDVWASHAVKVYPAALKFENPVAERSTQTRVSVQLQQVGTGEALTGRRVQAEVVRSYSVTVGNKTESREQRLAQATLTSDAAGRVSVNVPVSPDQEGDYVVRFTAKDSAGRTARASVTAASVYLPQGRKPAFNLALTADRAQYAPGATAKLTLKTDLPLGTPLLLSVNAEDRGEVKLLKVTGPQMNLSWPVTAAVQPAFTVQALAIRGGELLRSATEPLLVPRPDQKLSVKITPQGEVKPGEKATFTIQTTQGGRGTAAVVALAAVNESVYALAGDPTPNPWRFLWGATPPQVDIRSSSEEPDDGRGGGGGGGDEPYRSDLREVAAFQTVKTDATGVARVTVTMPEALGAYRLSARAVTRGGAAGEGQATQRVGLPFAVRLIRPRVLTQGDTGSVVVGAADRSGKGGATTLTLKAAGQTQTKTLTLSGGTATQLFTVKAPGSGDALTLQASAARGNEGDGIQESVPLRTAGNRLLITGAGTVKGNVAPTLQWPKGSQPESLVLDLAASPLQLALTGLDAALADPQDRWTTTDALSARLSSNLDLAALAGQFGWGAVRERALAQARRDLASLLALKSEEGWGWTERSAPSAEMTGRALDALVQAKGAGLTNAATLDAARRAAQKLWAKSPDSVILAVALTRAGAPQAGARLARAGVSDPVDAARLAAALAPTQPQLASALYDRARKAARTDKDGALVLGDAASWRGDSEPTALLLTAAAKLGRTADLPALTRAVLERRTGSAWSGGCGCWGGPNATAAAVEAIRALAAREGKPQPRSVTVKLGTFQKTLTVSAPTRLVVPAASIKAGPLNLSSAVSTAYAWELRVRRSGATPAPVSPLKIERRYDKTTVGRDGIVTVTLTLSTPTRLTHLRVTDPLPGGLEAVDDRPFSEQGEVNAAGSNRTVWADRALYDDRAVFYLEEVKPGTTTIRYRLRALASGDYTAPAPRVDFTSGAAPAEGSDQKVMVK